MRHALLALMMALLPLQAQALSCLAPTVERSFARFDAAPEVYIVVHGRLTFDESALPKGMTVDKDPPAMTHVPATLLGTSLTQDGFSLPFEQDVTLEVSCLGPWCGSAQTGEDVLAFLRKDEEAYAIAVEPCGGGMFGTPKPDMLEAATACMRDRDCTVE